MENDYLLLIMIPAIVMMFFVAIIVRMMIGRDLRLSVAALGFDLSIVSRASPSSPSVRRSSNGRFTRKES